MRTWSLGCFYSHNYEYPNLSKGADRVGGQLRGDKECPFNGVTKSGRVWRKVPESDSRRVCTAMVVAYGGGNLNVRKPTTRTYDSWHQDSCCVPDVETHWEQKRGVCMISLIDFEEASLMVLSSSPCGRPVRRSPPAWGQAPGLVRVGICIY